MSQFSTNPPMRRAGGGMDVYTGLLLAVMLVLVAGVFLLARANIAHSDVNGQGGGMLKLIG